MFNCFGHFKHFYNDDDYIRQYRKLCTVDQVIGLINTQTAAKKT